MSSSLASNFPANDIIRAFSAHLKVCIDLNVDDPNIIQFWTKFLRICPNFIHTHSVIMLSPLVNGQPDNMRVVMRQLEKVLVYTY